MKITFSPNSRTGTANPMLYGHFLEHFHRQIYGGVYDPTSVYADEDGFRTDVLEALRRIKPPIIRWPGGCFVSAYNWHYGVGSNRPATFDKAWRVEDSNAFGTDEFVKLCRKIGCEPYICTNGGTGTAEQMSDWVEYCNLETMGMYAKERIANGYPDPHNVRFWSIGNENWGRHEIGEKDSREWSHLVKEAAKMMLRVDPTLELSAAALSDLEWNLDLLKEAGCYLDWISVHLYWEGAPDGVTFPDYNRMMLHTGEDLHLPIDRVRAHLVATGLDKQIKIALDEWNLRGWYHPYVIDMWNREDKRHEDKAFYTHIIGERDKSDINSTYTMADAVFSACFLNTCLRNCDLVQMACFSPVVNTRGAIYVHEGGIVLRPTYYVFDLYANLMKQTVLNTWEEDAPAMTGMLWGKEKTVDTLDVVITRDDSGYAVSAINKDPESTHTITLRILDDTVSEMRIHTLNGPAPDSYNDVDRTEVGISVSEWVPFTGTVTLEPHSVNILELR